jgi:hypothetical protein
VETSPTGDRKRRRSQIHTGFRCIGWTTLVLVEGTPSRDANSDRPSGSARSEAHPGLRAYLPPQRCPTAISLQSLVHGRGTAFLAVQQLSASRESPVNIRADRGGASETHVRRATPHRSSTASATMNMPRGTRTDITGDHGIDRTRYNGDSIAVTWCHAQQLRDWRRSILGQRFLSAPGSAHR